MLSLLPYQLRQIKVTGHVEHTYQQNLQVKKYHLEMYYNFKQ